MEAMAWGSNVGDFQEMARAHLPAEPISSGESSERTPLLQFLRNHRSSARQLGTSLLRARAQIQSHQHPQDATKVKYLVRLPNTFGAGAAPRPMAATALRRGSTGTAALLR